MSIVPVAEPEVPVPLVPDVLSVPIVVLAVVLLSVAALEPVVLSVPIAVLAVVSVPVAEPEPVVVSVPVALAVVSVVEEAPEPLVPVPISELAVVSVPVAEDPVVDPEPAVELAVVSLPVAAPVPEPVVVSVPKLELAVVSVPVAAPVSVPVPMVPLALADICEQSDFTCACCSGDRVAQLVLISSSDFTVPAAGSEKKTFLIVSSHVGMPEADAPVVIDDWAKAAVPKVSETAVATTIL